MLSSLQIENVAVIQKANVHFEKGLNVLTGETGAGKSILIDSINAILGNRTSKDLVRTGAAKAVIRAAFDDVPPAVLDSLEKAGYERSEALTLSREITAEGKSTCRINGMPATAAILRELCGGLININGQHDSVGLLNPARHEGILDAYAQNGAVYQEYYAIYRELIKVKKELDAIITDEGEKQRKIDLLSYQVQEIEDASLTAGEEETLMARRKVLANASTIRERISQSYALLSGGDDAPGAVDLLGEASNAIDGAAQLDSGLSAAAGQLLDLYYTAKDLSTDLIGRLVFISVFFTSSVIIVLISVINSLGSISPRSICSSFVSQSAVISGDWISSGITVTRALPLSVGSSTLVFLVPLRSRKPFCTSFSMVAALVAGVPIP